MARGRNVPPAVVVAVPRAGDPSQNADCAYFQRHPKVRQYERDPLPGELPEAMPPGTKVVVFRIGEYTRVRAFRTPQEGLN